MSKATLKNVGAVTKDGRTIEFSEPVSVWAAMAAAKKAERQEPIGVKPVGAA